MIEVAIKNFVEFEFSKPPLYGIQRLRLTPKENEKQKIITWDIIFKGARKETEYFDHHGNFCCLLTFEKDIKTISINAEGVVGIRKTIGVVNDVSEIPYWLFKRHTDLAKPGRSIREFCKQFADLQYWDYQDRYYGRGSFFAKDWSMSRFFTYFYFLYERTKLPCSLCEWISKNERQRRSRRDPCMD